ncbi:unnamed protein product [Effrenium voratum]|nr:unnamed protein product [Effrenium voratum]
MGEATRREGAYSGLKSDAAARVQILFGQAQQAQFHSSWQVLMGQAEVQNWMRSTPGQEVAMRYPGEWKFAGGVVDPGETPQQAAMRELEEEFQITVALTEATCKLRLMSIKQTRPIRNVSNIMYNYVAAAEENPWLQELNLKDVNHSLGSRRQRFAESLQGGNFYTLGKEEQEKLAPEIHEAPQIFGAGSPPCAMWAAVFAALVLGSAGSGLELRVAKALGSKGYNKVRVSVVADDKQHAADFPFQYREQFKFRWTDNFLLSSVIELQAGPNELHIAEQPVIIDLPAEDEGIRGVFWADPCFSSKFVLCSFGKTFQTLERSTRLLNAAFEDSTMNVFGLLGDNFYDQTGELSREFFSRVSMNVKRRFWLMVNGNHDNWVCGLPVCGNQKDNFGIGQMQFYPMDSVASLQSPVFTFDLDPDQDKHWDRFLNNGTNFLFYHKLGNVGFVGYSGAADLDTVRPHMEAACRYFEETQPQVIFLLGHWNKGGLGCASEMSVPKIHQRLQQMPGCAGQRIKYMDGHEHCNYIQGQDHHNKYGFMLGGHGMADPFCLPQYGFVYLDTTQHRIRLFYFEIGRGSLWGILLGLLLGCYWGGLCGAALGFGFARCRRCGPRGIKWSSGLLGILGCAFGFGAGYFLGVYVLNPHFPVQDRYGDILSCVQSKGGLHACTHFAKPWLDEAVTEPMARFWL